MSLASVHCPNRRAVLSFAGAAVFILSLAAVDFVMNGALDLRALIPPFGASTVIVFFSPESPAGRAWNITAGHVGSALVATATLMLLPGLPVGVQAALAVAGAGLWMVLSKSIHPPGGATALLTTLAGHKVGMLAGILPLLAGCATLVSVRWLVDVGVRLRAVPRESIAPAE